LNRIFQAFECEREHAVVDPLMDVADALAVLPYELLRGEVIPGNLD
jgi:hypothetical protein